MFNPFLTEVRFQGPLTAAQRDAFTEAATRWSEVIEVHGRGPFLAEDTEAHLVIDARAVDLGGVGGALGRAGPTVLLTETGLPVRGIMEFDRADLDRLEGEGALFNTVLHEMGHVLGIGTLWPVHGLLRNANTINPRYVGLHAMQEYARLLGAPAPTRLPVENRGGPGTRDGHWRESVFQHELMTGFLNPGRNPLSRLTVASLRDLGYRVRMSAANSYELPARETLEGARHPWDCCHRFPPFAYHTQAEVAEALHAEPCEARVLAGAGRPS